MGSKKTVWVTGAQGFVGAEICRYFRTNNYRVVATDQEVSVCHLDELMKFALQYKPVVIINCAGIRRDKADLVNRMKAYDVNALGARNLALVAEKFHSLLVQISSDDVYSVTLSHSVDEFDIPHPDTPYGKSKRAGETMVRTITDNHLIVRSSWLYSASDRMVRDILEAAQAGTSVVMRTDQYAAPTSLSTYVATLAKMIAGRLTGTYHVTTTGSVSRYDFAAKVLSLAGYDPSVVLAGNSSASSAQYLVLKSVLLKSKGIELPSWDEDLREYMKAQGLLLSQRDSSFQNHDKVPRISLAG